MTRSFQSCVGALSVSMLHSMPLAFWKGFHAYPCPLVGAIRAFLKMNEEILVIKLAILFAL